MAAVEPGQVTVTTADGITTVSFFHPKSNSLPGALLAELAATITGLGKDPAVRVIVLRSEGPEGGAFCAGASFQELQAVEGAAQGKEFFMGFARVILAMVRCPRFIIARVHGKAVGGGVGLIAASDYAIAGSGAAVRLSELQVGIGPFVVGPVIRRKIGQSGLASLGINATEWRDAEWARERGLYAEVRESVAALDEAVAGLAARLAASNPEAMAAMKIALWRGSEDWDSLLETRASMSGTLVLSEFSRRAIAGN